MRMADYDSLREKYQEFRVPQVAVYVKNQKIDLTAYHLASATVDATAENEAAGVCELLFTGIYDLKNSCVDTKLLGALEVNQTLEVRMGYGTPVCVFYGKIDGVDIDFSFGESGPTLRVTGIDAKGLLMKAREDESKNLESTKEVVESILKQCKTDGAAKSVRVGNLLKFETPLRQEKTSDFDFLCEVARLTNANFFVSCGEVHFEDVLSKVDKCITLKWGKSLMRFSQSVDLSRQVSKVVVTGAKKEETEPVKGEATKVTMAGSGKLAADSYQKVKPEQEVENALATTEAIAKAIAEAELNHIAMHFVTCTGTCIGLPDIEVGKWMAVEGLSEYVDSTYFIYKVRHIFDENGYLTEFTLKGARTPK